MKRSLSFALLTSSLALGCDEKPTAGAAAAASAASVKAMESAAAAAFASAAASATPPPPPPSASSATSMLTGDARDVVLTVKDPAKEPEKTIKAGAGGSVTLFLPDFPGTVWSVGDADKALGKVKEEV